MRQFRLTKKYAKDCRITTLAEPSLVTHPLDDWFIDLIRVNRKKIAMATHAQSTFTFFIPYTEAGGAAAIPEYISILLKKFLYNHELSDWAKKIDDLFNHPIDFCNTVDRKILGHMNDFKCCADSCIDDSSYYSNTINLDQVFETINSMPVNFAAAGEYIYPIEILGKLLGHPLKAR